MTNIDSKAISAIVEKAKAKKAAAEVNGLSLIEPHEEEEAKKFIAQHMKELTGSEDLPRPAGYYVVAKTYIRPEQIKVIKGADGKDVPLYIPDQSRAEDKYQSVAALVIAVGPQAYKGKNFDGSDRFPEGPWCRVGDWIVLPRYEGFSFMFKGVPMQLLPDDKVLAVIRDPKDVSPTHYADKI